MSWKDAVRKVFENSGITVEEDQRGLVVLPETGNLRVLVLVRRLHMSFDRKVEVIAISEVSFSPPGVGETLKKMMLSSFEVEARGLLRRTYVWRSWRELHRLESLLGPVRPDLRLLETLKSDRNLVEKLKEASPNFLEVFPEFMSPSYMEAFLVSPGAPFNEFVKELISRYLVEPERLAWCFKAQFLYGSPQMPRKILKNYLLSVQLSEALKESTLKLFQYTSSSPPMAGSST
ncbi:MAG: hypothetical protein RMI04_00330 [Thermofilaceae archaeon]|nr:hypothetical protein [Thermofilaceae archaeon]